MSVFSLHSSNRNLILWSYPLVRDQDFRKQELLALPADTRVLFIKGTKDWMGPEIVYAPERNEMRAKTWCVYVADLDHSFNCKTPRQEAKNCNAIGTIAGMWLQQTEDSDETETGYGLGYRSPGGRLKVVAGSGCESAQDAGGCQA